MRQPYLAGVESSPLLIGRSRRLQQFTSPPARQVRINMISRVQGAGPAILFALSIRVLEILLILCELPVSLPLHGSLL